MDSPIFILSCSCVLAFIVIFTLTKLITRFAKKSDLPDDFKPDYE